MARVTDDQVKEIIETDLDTTPFIDTATILVDDLVGKCLSDEKLEKIELYLSAHFVTLQERVLKSDEFGDSKEEYFADIGKGLDSSNYGQTAKVLDTSGCLANFGNPKATLCVL